MIVIKGVIDMGTNSMRLAVAEVEDGKLTMLGQKVLYPRMGEGMGDERRIHALPLERNAEAAKELLIQGHSWGAENIRLTATSAVREAVNKEEVCRYMEEKTGVKVEVLSGEQEAQLSYNGASEDFLQEDRTLAVLDIGGGSTELVYQSEGKLCRASVPVGAVVLTEERLTWTEAEELLLDLVKEPLPENILLVGVGGTHTCLAAIEQKLKEYDSQRVHGFQLEKNRVAYWLELLQSVPTEERLNIDGLTPQRADILPAGVQIVLRMMELLQQEEITISDKGLVYGLLLEA